MIPDSWKERLDIVMSFESGWLNGSEGEPVKTQAKNIVEGILAAFHNENILNGQRPSIYPLIQGGIQLEWEENGIDYSIEIENNGYIELSAFGEEVDLVESFKTGASNKEDCKHVMEILNIMRAEVSKNVLKIEDNNKGN